MILISLQTGIWVNRQTGEGRWTVFRITEILGFNFSRFDNLFAGEEYRLSVWKGQFSTVKGILECWDKPLTVLDYNALKDEPLIDPTTIGLKGSPTNVFRSFTPPQKGAGQILGGTAEEAAKELAGLLAKKHAI